MADWGRPEESADQPAADQPNGTTTGNDASNTGNDATTAADDSKPVFKGWVEAKAYDYDQYNASGPGTGTNWEGSNAVYEWDGAEGDIGPEYPELERELFGDPDAQDERAPGIDFQVIRDIHVEQAGPVKLEPVFKFKDAGLHPAMLRNVELAGYNVPTPIQMFTIPAIRLGYDVIGIAQTGSGKTGAYLIPIIDKLMGKAKTMSATRPNPLTYDFRRDGLFQAQPLVVIVCPYRELAIQIFNEARKFCYRSMLRPCVVYGGGPLGLQIEQLSRGCDILVATPGRLIDFMDRPDVLTFRRVKYMVLDEADEMLHDDWSEEFAKIVSGGEQDEGNIKFMLFSATFPKQVRDLAKQHLAEDHCRLVVGRAGSTHGNIKQVVIQTTYATKRKELLKQLQEQDPARTIIFVNSKAAADELDDYLYQFGLPTTSMHSGRTQKEREDAMRAFRRGDAPILVATGVTARGIDVRNVMHVINFDLPRMEYGGIEEYTHRIGRTGRIGHRGLATSFYTDKDEDIAKQLTRTLMETNQEVPDFLEQFKPKLADGEKPKLNFEADSDHESSDGEGDAEDGGDDAGGWGADADGGNADGGNADGGWGADAAPAEDSKPAETGG